MPEKKVSCSTISLHELWDHLLNSANRLLLCEKSKTLESEDGLYGPLLWPFWDDNTAVQFSISKPFLSIEFVFWFWENQKGKWNFLEKIVVQPFFRQLLLPSVVRDSFIFLLLLLKFPKVENNQRFLFSVCFQNKAHNPTVNCFYT